MLKQTRNKGITLISLVITIIVLLILAGIVISLTIGENGVINRAKEAGEKYGQAQKNELSDLSDLEEQLGKYITDGVPENKEDTNAGTIVQLPNAWAMQTMRQVSTEDGKDIVDSIKIATVYAVATGNGEQVPVPYGFWYVGGNLSTGVIISDNEADSFLKNGKDMSSYTDSLNLQGNQFVWIPCTEENYIKTSWGKQNTNWDDTTHIGEKVQIQKYGGFYVARYEAGLATTIPEFTTKQQHTDSNQIYNKSGIPQSKSGQIPWNFISWSTAYENAQLMYSTNYVKSGLITGTQWDLILNTMINKSILTSADIATDSSVWGNYRNDNLTFSGDYSVLTTDWKYQYPFGDTSVTGWNLYKTGMCESAMRYGISDISGNLWEWTEEDSHYATSGQYRIVRGACFIDITSNYSASYRNGLYTTTYTGPVVGSRVVLYMK